MRFKKTIMTLACAVGLAANSSANASLLLTDSFSYPDGTLVGAPSSPWVSISGTAGQLDVTSGRTNVTGAESEDAASGLSGAPITAGTVYAGLTFQLSALPTATTTYFAMLTDAANGFRSRVHTTLTGAAAGSFRIGIGDASSAIVTIPVDLSLNTDYRFVVANDVATGRSTLYLNPTTETGGVVATDATTPQTISRFGLRQSAGIGTISVDNLIVATTFSEAATVPEPTSLALVAIGAVGLLRRRARRA